MDLPYFDIGRRAVELLLAEDAEARVHKLTDGAAVARFGGRAGPDQRVNRTVTIWNGRSRSSGPAGVIGRSSRSVSTAAAGSNELRSLARPGTPCAS